MIDKLNTIINKHKELANQLGNPETINDIALYKKISQEYSNLKDKATLAQAYLDKIKEIDEVTQLIEQENDLEIKQLANDELINLKNDISKLEHSIKQLLVESDPDDAKNII